MLAFIPVAAVTNSHHTFTSILLQFWRSEVQSGSRRTTSRCEQEGVPSGEQGKIFREIHFFAFPSSQRSPSSFGGDAFLHLRGQQLLAEVCSHCISLVLRFLHHISFLTPLRFAITLTHPDNPDKSPHLSLYICKALFPRQVTNSQIAAIRMWPSLGGHCLVYHTFSTNK